MRVISNADMLMPAPVSTYAHDRAMTAKSAVMTTTRSRLITASSVASMGTVLTSHPIMFAEFGLCLICATVDTGRFRRSRVKPCREP